MYKIISISTILFLFFISNVYALDKFLMYRDTTPASHSTEISPAVPEANFAIKQGYIYTNVLAANVAEVVTVPTGAKFFVLNATADVWVKVGAAGSVPAGDTTNDTGSELNPGARYLDSDTTIGIISESACKVSIMFYN